MMMWHWLPPFIRIYREWNHHRNQEPGGGKQTVWQIDARVYRKVLKTKVTEPCWNFTFLFAFRFNVLHHYLYFKAAREISSQENAPHKRGAVESRMFSLLRFVSGVKTYFHQNKTIFWIFITDCNYRDDWQHLVRHSTERSISALWNCSSNECNISVALTEKLASNERTRKILITPTFWRYLQN